MEQPPRIFGGQEPQPHELDGLDGTRSTTFMSTVFTWMVIGLAVTACISYWASTSELYWSLMQGMGRWMLILAPFAFLMVMNFGLQRLSVSALALVFLAFAGTMGLSLAGVFMMYSLNSITQVFVISAGTFAVMAIAGYTTSVDLSRMGSLLFMGLVGIVLASLVNWWLQSSPLDFVISVGGVLIFTGLVAYDTQRLKRMASGLEYAGIDGTKLALLGAASLYLDFLNLFLFLLRLLGRRD